MPVKFLTDADVAQDAGENGGSADKVISQRGAQALAQNVLAQAKESGEFDGKDGQNGKDGQDGKDGKTAYEYAKDGGYTGTVEEFAAKLAKEIPDAYALPTASATEKGGVMIGDGLYMDGDKLNVKNEVENHSNNVVNLFPDNISFVLRDFRRWGKVCQFVIQFNITETVSGSYSFAVFELPFKSIGRVWLNNATAYYIAANEKVIRRNATNIATGNITLSGMYLTNE